MAGFSLPAERAIQDFAASAGLRASAAPDGSYSFRFDDLSVLTFTPTDRSAFLASLAFRLYRDDESTAAALMAAAGYDETNDRFVHAGRAPDGTCVLAVMLDGERADLPAIDAACLGLKSIRGALG